MKVAPRFHRSMTEPSAEQSSEPNRNVRRRRFIAAATAAGIAILAVLAGVYGMGALRSNPAPPAGACAPAVETASRIAPLAQGEVAALAVAHAPFPVPDLTFKDAAGHDRKLADWRGRTVLLNLWATWCVPCRKEMPALDALQNNLGGDKFEVVAVNIDTRNAEKPLAFLKDAGVKHLTYYADQSAKVFTELKQAGKAFGMPTTLIVDRSGCELGTMAGPAEWASADGMKLVSAAIADDKNSVSR
jgi:thiol-disulfide isomerase/thioredoxin